MTKFHAATAETYRSIYHHPLDQKLWKMALDCDYAVDDINNAFSIAYRIHDLTRHHRILELCSGGGLLGIILLRKKWATFVYQVDNFLPNKLVDRVTKFGVRHQWVFLHINLFNKTEVTAMSHLNYDVIVAISACGSTADIAIGLSIAMRKKLIVMPCCWRAVCDDDLWRLTRKMCP